MLFSYVPFGVTIMVLGCPDYLQSVEGDGISDGNRSNVCSGSGTGEAGSEEIGDENGEKGGDEVTVCLPEHLLASSEAAGFSNISDPITTVMGAEDEQISVNGKTESECSVAKATCMVELVVTNTPGEREVI